MCAKCEWEKYVEKIDSMLEEEKYEFAEDTLTGIKDWVEANEHVTAKQKDAIDNIEESRE